MKELRKEEKHPTYGIIGINRVSSSNPGNLFGSSIKHRTQIDITIKEAKLERNLSHDWVFGDKQIIRITLSPTQFADMLTNMNMGDGVPCTIKYREGVGYIEEECPYVNKKQQFDIEFENTMKDVAKNFDKLIKLNEDNLDKNSKNTRKELMEGLKLLRQKISSDMPFMNETFTKQMDRTVTEAKGEVEAFVSNLVRKTGLEAIKKQAPLLLEEETGDIK